MVGGNVWIKRNQNTAIMDLAKKIPAGFYFVFMLSRDTINSPIQGNYSAVIISTGYSDMILGMDGAFIFARYTGAGRLIWNKVV